MKNAYKNQTNTSNIAMKNIANSPKFLSLAVLAAFMTFMAAGLNAQRVSLTMNANPVTSNKVSGDDASFINLEGSTKPQPEP